MAKRQASSKVAISGEVSVEERESDVLAAFESGKPADVQVTSKGAVQSDSKLGTDQNQEPILLTGPARPESHVKQESSLEGMLLLMGMIGILQAELAQLRPK